VPSRLLAAAAVAAVDDNCGIGVVGFASLGMTTSYNQLATN